MTVSSVVLTTVTTSLDEVSSPQGRLPLSVVRKGKGEISLQGLAVGTDLQVRPIVPSPVEGEA